jgi:hypothetical protein
VELTAVDLVRLADHREQALVDDRTDLVDVGDPFRITTNSSPPSRLTVSTARTEATMRSATERSRPSPT